MTIRRKADVMKEFMLPVISAVCVGFGASYIGVKVSLGVVTTQVGYIERDIKRLSVELNQLAINAETAEHFIRYEEYTERRLQGIERAQLAIIDQIKDRYTRTEASKDFAYHDKRITALEVISEHQDK